METTEMAIESLEEQVAELEQQLLDMEAEMEELEQEMLNEQAELEDQLLAEMEEVAEEALAVGYELGYLESSCKHAERAAYVAQAGLAFDEIMGSPEVVDFEPMEDLVEDTQELTAYYEDEEEDISFDLDSIDDLDDDYVADDEEDLEEYNELEDEEEDAEFPEEDEEEWVDEHDDTEVSTAVDAAAAIRHWISDVDPKPAVDVEQETLELEEEPETV